MWSAFQYAFNWVIVVTILDLSWTISVLAGTMTIATFKKRKTVSYASTIFLSLAYTIMISIMLGDFFKDYIVTYETTAFVAYLLQLTVYSLSVCLCLLPAMKRLDQMLNERRDVLC